MYQKVRPVLKFLWKNLSDGTLKPRKIKSKVFLDWISKKCVKFQKEILKSNTWFHLLKLLRTNSRIRPIRPISSIKPISPIRSRQQGSCDGTFDCSTCDDFGNIGLNFIEKCAQWAQSAWLVTIKVGSIISKIVTSWTIKCAITTL